LAHQIRDGFASYGRHSGLRHTVIHGGVGQGAQVKALSQGVDILVATPGRLLDLLNQRELALDAIEILVLDQANPILAIGFMPDMGFLHDVRLIVARVPAKRQTLFFSATMPNEVMRLAESILSNYTRIEVTPPSTTVERIAQRVMFVTRENKRRLLDDLLRGK